MPLVAGCGDGDLAVEPRLSGAAPTVDSLGAAVWAGLVTGDTAALRQLRLSEAEHNEIVWPEQPAAKQPSAQENLDFWWRNIEVRNRAALDNLFTRFRGSAMEFLAVDCPGEARSYDSFRALTGCVLVLAGQDGPARVAAFRYVIEMDGVYKLVRYYDE